MNNWQTGTIEQKHTGMQGNKHYWHMLHISSFDNYTEISSNCG